jgi:hypothetical protein
VLLFPLARRARVEITVYGPGPSCTRLGTFTRRGHAGLNRIRFSGHLFGRKLPPGRYAIVVEAVRGQARTVVGSVVVSLLPRDGREGGSRPLATPDCRASGRIASTAAAVPTARAVSSDQPAGPTSGVAAVAATRASGDGVLPGIDVVPASPWPLGRGTFDFPWLWVVIGAIGGLLAYAGTAGARVFRRYRAVRY